MGEESRLPTTGYAILGLLTFGEMSGYDLTKAAQGSVGFFWSPAKSQVYSELRRLVSLGFATEREVEQQDRPDKRVYRVTPEGEAALREWLNDPVVEPEQIKSPFLLKVFFGHLMDREALGAQVKEWRRQAEDLLAQFREIERHIKGEEAYFFPYLTLRCGLAHARADIRWTDEVLGRLEEREGR